MFSFCISSMWCCRRILFFLYYYKKIDARLSFYHWEYIQCMQLVVIFYNYIYIPYVYIYVFMLKIWVHITLYIKIHKLFKSRLSSSHHCITARQKSEVFHIIIFYFIVYAGRMFLSKHQAIKFISLCGCLSAIWLINYKINYSLEAG